MQRQTKVFGKALFRVRFSLVMISLIKNHGGLIFICFVIFIFSSLGQTYFISWWNPHIQESYGLSRTTLGFLYSGATLPPLFPFPP